MTGPRWSVRAVAVAAALLAAGPALAQARLELNGLLGTAYGRANTSTSTPFLDRGSLSSTWELVGGAGLAWRPFRPGLLQFDANVDYRHYQTYSQDDSRADGVTYGSALSLFTDSPLNLDLSASRSRSEFSGDLTAGKTGSTTTQQERVGLTLRQQDLPSLRAAYSRSAFTNVNFDDARTRGGSDNLALGLGQSFAAFDYSAAYDTSWSRGDFVNSNYQSHQLMLQTSARPAEGLDLRLTDSWFQREPSVLDPQNPRYENNLLSAGVGWRPRQGLMVSGLLSDSRNTLDQPGQPARYLRTQTATEVAEYRFLPEWWAIQSLGATRGEDLIGDERSLGYSGVGGGGVRWLRQRDGDRYQAELQANAGAFRDSLGGGTQLAGGGRGDLGLGIDQFTRRWQFSYSGGYARNTAGQEGWDADQALSAAVEWLGGAGKRARLKLEGSQQIQQRRVGGRSDAKQVRLELSGRLHPVGVTASAGLSEGASEILRPDTSGGPPVPESLKTRRQFAQASVSTALWRNTLTAVLLANYLRSSTPGQPFTEELAFNGVLALSLGAFVFSVEDRYAIGTVAGTTSRANYLYARITRSFAARF